MFLSRRKEESMQNDQTPATDYEQQNYPEPKAHDNLITLIESSGSAVMGVLKSIEGMGIKVEG